MATVTNPTQQQIAASKIAIELYRDKVLTAYQLVEFLVAMNCCKFTGNPSPADILTALGI